MENLTEEGQQPASKSFFLKLMDGDFGLSDTYWLYGVVSGFGIRFIFWVLDHAQAHLVVFVALWLLALAYQIMVWIGIWRAAEKYQGDGIWVVAAKVMVVVGIVFTAFPLFQAFNNQQ